MKEAVRENYEAVIGLEVHAQLLTKSKIYNTDSTIFGSSPNTNVGVVTLAHPGTLPKLNRVAVEYAMKMGLACNCEISRLNIFDRKNYFYPDLPKGYQLTQDRTPICKGGYLKISTRNGDRIINFNRIHIEEDAGKSIHQPGESDTLVDLNRAGVSLIEIVTEPVLQSSEEAGVLLTEIRRIVRYLEICDGNMEEGSLRCDANVSIRLKGTKSLGKKVEIKNMNSVKNVQRAIDHEIQRQIDIAVRGGEIISETRMFDVSTGESFALRAKEELNDYRYFPDPDLSPMIVSEEWLDEIRRSMPELPAKLKEKFEQVYGIPAYDAAVIVDSKDTANYFEEVCRHTSNYKAASNWIMGPVKSYLNETDDRGNSFPVKPDVLAQLISLIDEGKISFTIASQRVFPELLRNPDQSPLEVAQQLNVLQDSNSDSLSPIIDQILKEFPLKIEEYKSGKKGIVTMFMGEVMKRSKGKADPKLASDLLNIKLKAIK
jgi:aspartyl-tRNA(Asn)/glutamyl-tRNA(Gln) amidotransferase subunit B